MTGKTKFLLSLGLALCLLSACATSAKERKNTLEGWVDIEFTISADGSVKNPRVIAAQPPNKFEQSALRAIRKWKYKPTIRNGVAVETPGVRIRFKFDLEQL